jgi:hypothetical protein
MLGLTSIEILRYRYLSKSSKERWVSLLHFFLLKICNFYVFFFIYIIFLYTRVSDRSMSIMCICGASATNALCKE